MGGRLAQIPPPHELKLWKERECIIDSLENGMSINGLSHVLRCSRNTLKIFLQRIGYAYNGGNTGQHAQT